MRNEANGWEKKEKPRYDKLYAYRNANQQWNESVARKVVIASNIICWRRDVIARIAPIPHGQSNVSGNAVNPTPRRGRNSGTW